MVKREIKDAWWLVKKKKKNTNIWKVEEWKKDGWGDIESEMWLGIECRSSVMEVKCMENRNMGEE